MMFLKTALFSMMSVSLAAAQSLDLIATNLNFFQPFSPFFYMVHDETVTPLFEFGAPASPALAALAETGNPSDLVALYTGVPGVGSVGATAGPTVPGDPAVIPITPSDRYPYVTVAAMAVNTNDGFVALNGVPAIPGMVFYEPGLDAGSEVNDENCTNIPGPACPDSPNGSPGMGEGYVAVHRGVNGFADLVASDADWRNPMVRFVVDDAISLALQITNLNFRQPFSPFFYMVHDSSVGPLFELGAPAIPELATLAEEGDPSQLVTLFTGMPGVSMVGASNGGAPPGNTLTINLRVDEVHRYVTVAAMAINTNDAFVALNGVEIYPGFLEFGVGYDAGSEENNEMCPSVPGPACGPASGNVASGNGEGFVAVHRGVQGIAGLNPQNTDWRNPMVQFYVG